MFGKGWRVKDDKVEICTAMPQEVEGIFGESLMARFSGEVQLYIGTSEFNCLFACIHTNYPLGTATKCINRETTRITEHVENIASGGKLFKQQAVVTLVDEETSLLSGKPIDMEAKTLFCSNMLACTATNEISLLLG